MKLCPLRSEDEYNYKNCFRITSEKFKEIFYLIKDDTTKENTETRDLIPQTIT